MSFSQRPPSSSLARESRLAHSVAPAESVCQPLHGLYNAGCVAPPPSPACTQLQTLINSTCDTCNVCTALQAAHDASCTGAATASVDQPFGVPAQAQLVIRGGECDAQWCDSTMATYSIVAGSTWGTLPEGNLRTEYIRRGCKAGL